MLKKILSHHDLVRRRNILQIGFLCLRVKNIRCNSHNLLCGVDQLVALDFWLVLSRLGLNMI